ncbi:MAG: enoyl-CoA hydratase/isomerase family protein [Rhodospirillaceae bacterium]|nr:enoyl-CoA hydratase/isomerase family protein [Rhodospirillaceae bacterium]
MSGDIAYAVDSDGIATLTIDMKARSMNVLADALTAELSVLVDKAVADAKVKGVIITSGKSSFVAGADLRELEQLAFGPLKNDAQKLLDQAGIVTRFFRKLEVSGKPFVAAITGTALGGGLELCLACHHRIAADNPKAQLGLPEVKVGLLPGAGGTQRLPRLIGVKAALPLLLEGTALSPQEALKTGIVHAVVPADQLLSAAKAWLMGSPSAKQPWDVDGFVTPGPVGQKSDDAANFYAGASGMLQKKTLHNYPAPAAILSCVYEGAQVPMDAALGIEIRYFCSLLRDPVAGNIVRTMFVNKQAAEKLEARPKNIPPSQVKKLGVLGGGMMGQGITYVAAKAGIDVVILDRSQDLADKGKSYSKGILDKAIARGLDTQANAEALLKRITPVTDFAALKDVDMVIEAVFEDRAVKADVTKKTEAVIRPDIVFASNTSTLPISGLAETFSRPDQFIGLHFFSPVDKMALVEVIKGAKTSPETLAKALDLVKQIRKTPIVVNDSRGFYTSRVFRTFADEGMVMLTQGVKPALVENGGRMAGMPVGPLAIADEVSIQLIYMVRDAEKTDLGTAYKPHPVEPVLELFVKKLNRLGRKNKAGFYDYPDDGKKALWSGIAQHFPPAAQQPSIDEVKKRILYRQALEAVQCLEENVITKPADGDIGAVLGWGYAMHTGGPFCMIDTIGVKAFVAECDRMAQAYGDSFAPPDLLRRMAAKNERFYPLPQ